MIRLLRRLPRKLVLLLLTISLSVVGYWQWSLQSAAAQRSGSLSLTGLKQPVNVYYDAWGVPHIDAANDLDAMRTLGYLHAQDRLFQMDMLRRVGNGRLAELLGQEAFATDRFFRTLGIARHARQYAEQLKTRQDQPQVKSLLAYQDGINQYIDSGKRPLEYRLLMRRPQAFTPEDIIGIIGYMAYSFAEGFKTDALLDHVHGTLGERHLRDLVPGWPDELPPRLQPATGNDPELSSEQQASLLTPLLQQLADIQKNLPVGQFMGSNAWVISAERSASGAPLLANDPHIGFSVPAVWHEAHIRTPEHDVYGHFVPGLPFPLLGHTRQHAWGLTMLMNDDTDFYRERSNPENPEQVWAVDRWQNLRIHEEVIRVRGQEDRLVRVRHSRHGPIINDLPGNLQTGVERQPVSLHWGFTAAENDILGTLYALGKASGLQEVEQAAALHGAPGLNLVYADTQGNIAMWAMGKLKPQSSRNRFRLLNGGSGRDDFTGYQPFSANPRIINPRSGIIYSANHPYPGSGNRRLLEGYYAPSERAERLAELLEGREQLELSDIKSFQLDNQRPQALAMVAEALPILRDELLRSDLRAPAMQAARHLDLWDGRFSAESIGATLFQRWQDYLMEALFADELGRQYEFFRDTMMAEKSLNRLFWKPASPWWDNRRQPMLDGRQAAIEQAWIRTIESLVEQFGIDPQDWQWRHVASLRHEHPLTGKIPFTGSFSTEPVAVNGGRESINNMYHGLGGPHYAIKLGPSTRRLIDLADLNGTLGINPLGQSGNPKDNHFSDQAALFNEGRYRTQLFDWQSIEALPDRLQVKPRKRR